MMIPQSIMSLEDFKKLTFEECQQIFGEDEVYIYLSFGKNCIIRRSGKFMQDSAAKGLSRAAVNLIKGGVVDPTERLKICAGCPLYTNGKCAKCGCFLEAKARIKYEQCPEGKW